MLKRIWPKTAYVFVFLSLGAGLCFAQAPASTKAGIIQEKIQEETKKEEPFKVEEKKPLPQVEDQRAAPPVLKMEPKVRILIKKFTLVGVTKFKPEDFTVYLAQFRGKELGIDELNAIASYIQNFYRQKGYITTFVYIGPQDIKDNTLEIQVIEGYIGQVEAEGGKYFNRERLREESRIRAGETILYKDLIRKVRRLNLHPDRSVKAVLIKGEKFETTDVILKMTDSRPQHAFFEYDNRGTRYIGKQRFSTGYINNNLLGIEDILSLRFLKGNEKLIGGSFDYNFPLTYDELRLGMNFSYSNVDILREFRALGAEGRALIGGVYLTYPFFDEEHLRSRWTFGFDVKRSENRILDTKTSQDNLSVAKMNVSLSQDDRFGSTFVGQELDFGIPDFAGSLGKEDTRASRLGAGGEFSKYTMNLRRQINLPFSSYLLLVSRCQYSPDKLVAGEQFYIGGADTVRGYPELEYMGDYGYNVNVELRTPLWLLPKSIQDRVQFVYFWDFGQGYLRNALVGEEKSKSLMGAGWGLRLNLWKNFYLKADWGFPLDPQPSDKSKSTAHLWAHWDLF